MPEAKNIKVDTEKIKAIKMYAGDYDVDRYIQSAVDDAVKRLYVKVVPKLVREYIEGNVKPNASKKSTEGD